MAALEHDDYAGRLSERYAEQVAGLRDQMKAVNHNAATAIYESRELVKKIDAVLVEIGRCAGELGHIRSWQRWHNVLVIALVFGVIALLIKVF